MSLSAGERLGSYEILEPIDAGGMGEVYHARDTNLGRDVAIKVLPEDFSSDPDRLARFRREAKLLASLNHPDPTTPSSLPRGATDSGAYRPTAVSRRGWLRTTLQQEVLGGPRSYPVASR